MVNQWMMYKLSRVSKTLKMLYCTRALVDKAFRILDYWTMRGMLPYIYINIYIILYIYTKISVETCKWGSCFAHTMILSGSPMQGTNSNEQSLSILLWVEVSDNNREASLYDLTHQTLTVHKYFPLHAGMQY